MKIPDGRTPEEFNWADYCDALWTESFMQSRVKQQSAQDKAVGADHVKSVKPQFDFHALDKSNWAEYCDALRNESFARSMMERKL
jgi:hypothetical protein